MYKKSPESTSRNDNLVREKYTLYPNKLKCSRVVLLMLCYVNNPRTSHVSQTTKICRTKNKVVRLFTVSRTVCHSLL